MLNVQHVTYSSEEQCRRAPTPLCGLRPTALNKLRAQKVTLWLFYQSQLPETVCNHFQARNQMAPLPILGSTWQNHPSAGSNRAGALQSWEAVLTAGKNLCAGWRAQGTLEGHLQERTEVSVCVKNQSQGQKIVMAGDEKGTEWKWGQMGFPLRYVQRETLYSEGWVGGKH